MPRDACALLGVVTHVANNFEVDAIRKDGSACKKKIGDTVTPLRAKVLAKAKVTIELASPAAEDLELPDQDWTDKWELEATAKANAQPRHWVARVKAKHRAKASKAQAASGSRNLSRSVEQAAIELLPDTAQAPAPSRIQALLARVRLEATITDRATTTPEAFSALFGVGR